jgi:glycosyltransferase involved in cell wall biosynthesis
MALGSMAPAIGWVQPSDPARPAPGARRLDLAARRALQLGLRRIHILAWRDLDDPEAGGSEMHAHRVAGLWAAGGLDVTMRTSTVHGSDGLVERDGYRVRRRAGRYAVFPRAVLDAAWGPSRHCDGLVEIWNGMPFLSPLWTRRPRVVFLHHVHAEMWRMVLPPALARVGELMETRLAPRLYRRSRIVTLSSSSRDEIVSMLAIPEHNVTVVPPGVDGLFTPGGAKAPDPLVVAVGRLVPVKRFDRLIDGLVDARRLHPRLQAVIVGEGVERGRLEEKLRTTGAAGWIGLPGHVPAVQLRDLYRRAWVVASASQREGWGLSLSEAAACGTPAVATRIAGHRDAVRDGVDGLLAEGPEDMGAALAVVLANVRLRSQLSRAALDRARRLAWEITSAGALEALLGEVEANLVRRR